MNDNARKKFVDDIREFKGLSLLLSVGFFFCGWIFLSLFRGIDGFSDKEFLGLVVAYFGIIHLNSIVFLPAAVMHMKPRRKGRLKGVDLEAVTFIYALLSAVAYTFINKQDFGGWGTFRTVLFGVACLALNLFIAKASLFWIWINYSITFFLISLVFTTVCDYLMMHAIAKSVIFIFFGLILCIGSSSQKASGSENDFAAEMDRAIEDYFIITESMGMASGKWML